MFLVNERDVRPDAEKRAGIQVHNLRVAHGWSQREVAERMKPFGYNWQQATVARIESATRPLRLNELLDLAALFHVSLTDLLVPPMGRDSLEQVRQEKKALELALEQAEERAKQAAVDAAEHAQAHALVMAEVESIRSRLQLLRELEKEALGDDQA
jgi:transcriptional regulator with XRE-family HTH domain